MFSVLGNSLGSGPFILAINVDDGIRLELEVRLNHLLTHQECLNLTSYSAYISHTQLVKVT